MIEYLTTVLILGPLAYLFYLSQQDPYFLNKISYFFDLLRFASIVKLHQYANAKKPWSFVDFFESQVMRHPDHVQFITVEDDRKITLTEMDNQANQLGRWGTTLGLKQHDTIAIIMLNKPEVVIFWLGMAKIGVGTALINSNVTGKPFLHSVEVSVKDSKTQIVIIDNELKETLKAEVQELRQQGILVYFWNDIISSLSAISSYPIPKTFRDQIREKDPLIYIFTSGTTGLPKACKVSSSKFFQNTLPVSCFLRLNQGDRFYNCLPLYHSAGGMVALGGCIRAGATMVLRKKFSVRNFTPDCLQYQCNAMQYIGELCRYLVNAPPCEDDHKLQLKYAIGNGMRPDIWVAFQKRYNVKNIVEFYGATEGNVGCFNNIGKVGAIGYMPLFLQKFKSIKILRVDPECREKPLRTKDGLCIIADYGEVGLLTSEIDQKNVNTRFDGYSDPKSTEKKLLKDVLKLGDTYFNTGDLIYRDADGYFYWSDRVGDTFRWKGENVATTEVENCISVVKGISEVTVYGVTVPNCDGRVGMASLILHENIKPSEMDWKLFHAECVKNLPTYARPAFIRIQSAIQVTGTFKHQKSVLVEDGFDPSKVGKDILFMYQQKDGQMIPLTQEIYQKIQKGEIKL